MKTILEAVPEDVMLGPINPVSETGVKRRSKDAKRNFEPLFSKGNDVTGTDPEFFKTIDAEFHFVCDMAANAQNRKVQAYFGPDHEDESRRNCLKVDWPTDGPVWVNPPYSKAYPFVQKAATERLRGVTTVLLLASRTDTRWFHDFIYDTAFADERDGITIRFLRRRLKFEGHKNSAPFPSMLVVMRPTTSHPEFEIGFRA